MNARPATPLTDALDRAMLAANRPVATDALKLCQRLEAERAQLVAALREQVDTFGAKAADEVDSPRIAKMRALLRQLGEAE